MEYTKEILENAVKNSNNYASVCRFLGLQDKGINVMNVKNKILFYGIDTSHFQRRHWNTKVYGKAKPLNDILQNGVKYQSSKLKWRLIKEGIKEYKCEKCGNINWCGGPIPLELHHINGNHYDNRLENLILLCPNCHSLEHVNFKQTRYNLEVKGVSEIILAEIQKEKVKEKKDKPKIIKNEKPKRFCLTCGKELTNSQTKYCSQECATKSYTKRIDKEELIKVLEENNYNLTQVGKLYNVSANAIKKWCKHYNIVKDNYFHSKKIRQYDLNDNFVKEFKSITEAMNETNITTIKKCLQGKAQSAGGFIWRYANEENDS